MSTFRKQYLGIDASLIPFDENDNKVSSGSKPEGDLFIDYNAFLTLNKRPLFHLLYTAGLTEGK